jgi:Lysophospholipase L1 and related esterases
MNKAVLTALAASLMILNFFPTLAQQRDWANFGCYAEQNKTELLQLNKDDSRNIRMKTITKNFRPTAVLFGDSIIEMWYIRDSSFFAENGYLGRGISGQTSSELLVRFRQDVIGLNPKVVVILCGINDLAGNNGYISIDDTAGNIYSMCELAKLHGIKVVLCSLLPSDHCPWNPSADFRTGVSELNSRLSAYASANKITYIDYFSPFTDGNKGMKPGLSKDNVHPNLEMYKLMEPMLVDAIHKARK